MALTKDWGYYVILIICIFDNERLLGLSHGTKKYNLCLSFQRKNNSQISPPVCGHSKIDKTKILMTNGSLMKVESIAECSKGGILQYFQPSLSRAFCSTKGSILQFFQPSLSRAFCNTFDLHKLPSFDLH